MALERVSRSGESSSPPTRKAVAAVTAPAQPNQGHHTSPKGRASSLVARSWARPLAIDQVRALPDASSSTRAAGGPRDLSR